MRYFSSLIVGLFLSGMLMGQEKEILYFSHQFSVASEMNQPATRALESYTHYHGYRLEEKTDTETRSIPFQIVFSDHFEICWIASGPILEGESRDYSLIECSSAVPGNSVVGIVSTDSSFMFMKDQQTVLAYQYGFMEAPEGVSPYYGRSGFIHPLYAPSGQVLSWVQPPDHYHHYGLWNPWTRVSWKDNVTDFWNLASRQGTVRFTELLSKSSGSVCAELKVRHEHVAFNDGRNDNWPSGVEQIEVLSETWTIRLWNMSGGFMIDFTSDLKVMIDEPVSLDAYRYSGGLGFRATPEWTASNSEVITSEGKTWENGDASRAKWCRVYGTTAGIMNGVLFLSDPRNYDFPQTMRIWPKKMVGDKSYHFFEFCPVRENAWILHPGKEYHQRYRLWVSEGDMSNEEMELMWKVYAGANQNNH